MALFTTNKSASELKEQARQDFKKVVGLKGEGRTERSLRARMAMLIRAHVDKTFIDGAEKTALYQDVLMAAIAAGQSVPEEPQPVLYQQIDTSQGKSVWVYLPDEYSEQFFQLGRRYQRVDITAEAAIESAQKLLDQICRLEFKLDYELSALAFLRDEIGQDSVTEQDGD
jgi:hypothetical protein